MTRSLRFAALLLAGLSSLPVSAAVQAWVDRTQVPAGGTVQLTLQHDGKTDSQPDISALKQDFDILSRSTGSSIQVINGSMSMQLQVQLALYPRHTGHIRIPPLQWGKEQSAPIELDVVKSTASSKPGAAFSGSGNEHTFVTSTLDQDQPYVQAGTQLTIRIYTDQPLFQASLTPPESNDVQIRQIGKDTAHSEVRNGKQYQVLERKFLLFPQHSGKIKLDGPLLAAEIEDRSNQNPFLNDPVFGNNPLAAMMGERRPIQIRGAPIMFNVRPQPESYKGTWLPAREVSLSEQWQPSGNTIHAGEPLTRHLGLKAIGITAEQLPDLSTSMSLPDGIRMYPDQAKLDTQVQGNDVVGRRDQNVAFIASQPGHYQLPEIRLSWWDTAHNREQFATLPARTLDVLPAKPGEGGAASIQMAPSGPVQEQTKTGPAQAKPTFLQRLQTGLPWPWISLVLAVLWLTTLLAWWRSRRAGPAQTVQASPPEPSPPKNVPGGNAFKSFRLACQQNDVYSARKHLLAWAKTRWADAPPQGLSALAKKIDRPDVETLLKQLDAACYAGAEWQGEALLKAMEALPGNRQTAGQAAPALPGLYD